MPSYPALRCTLPYFLLLAIATYILLSSSCKDREQKIDNSPESQLDSVSPSQVTILADLPDSLQPKTIFVENTPAPITIRPTDSEGPFSIRYRFGREEVYYSLDKKIKARFSPLLQNYTVEQGLAVDVTTCGYLDKKGNLWFGTPVGGVSKYDGASFTTYSTSNGLNNNTVDDILEDKHGNMWFATDQGLSKFDGRSFSTVGNFNKVLALLEDQEGNLWIGTNSNGTFKYTGDSIIQFSKADGLLSNCISALKQDKLGIIWLGTNDGLYKYDGARFHLVTDSTININALAVDKNNMVWGTTDKGNYQYDHTSQFQILSTGVNSSIIYSDLQDNVWCETRKNGLFSFDYTSPSHYKEFNGFTYGEVRSVVEDQSGNIWFGTAANGVVKYSGPSIQKITDNSIRSIMEDKDGNLWYAGYEGHVSQLDGQWINHSGFNVAYWTLFQDKSGNIWCGTEISGLIKYDHSSYTFYTDANGLPGRFISCIEQSSTGELWIGTLDGISKFDGKAFTNFSKKQGIASQKIWSILSISDTLFIGGDEGLSIYDGKSFTNYIISHDPGGNDIRSMIYDSNGNLWMAMYGGGLCRFDGKSFHRYTTAEGLPDNVVTQVALTKEGYIIAGTNNGLAILTGYTGIPDPETRNATNISINGNYLPQNSLSNRELKNFAPVFEIYNSANGYPIMDVNRGHHAILVDSKGIIWVASGSAKSGLMRFDYKSLHKNKNSPLVNILSIQVNNEKVCWNDLWKKKKSFVPAAYKYEQITVPDAVTEEITTFGRPLADTVRASLLKKYKGVQFDSISKFYPVPINLTLPYRHNKLSIAFAAIEPDKPSLVQYQYKLEGYDDNWSTPANVTSATYGNIHEGNYTFNVKARSPSGIWSEPISYSFTVLPPPYRTGWAYLLYTLLFASLIYESFNLYKRRLKLQLQRKADQDEANRLRELDTFKSQLFTNLTHEFRTPLTVILGMVKQLAVGSWQLTVGNIEKARVSRGLELIENNGKNLLQLINQLLDLSKLENKSFKLNNIQSDIVPYLRYVTESFQSYAEDKHLSLNFTSETDTKVMDFDPEQIKQVLTNLISNAVKFTPPGGDVTVKMSASKDELQIVVIDNGIGISEQDLPYILDRFYQADSSSTRAAQGTGIGLAHTQELLKVMNGSISVQSQLSKGTTVHITLPIRHEGIITPTDEIAHTYKPQLSPHYSKGKNISDDGVQQQQPSAFDENFPQLLIIEDNPDVVEYLTSCLEQSYNIHVGFNGKKGVDLAIEIIPDIIISDVMMPEMDGFQACERLKNDDRTSHIPIILLTAKADAASRLTGLRRGADAYMAKPFSPEELHIQISMLLENRSRMAAYFSKLIERGPSVLSEVELVPEAIQFEDAFMKKVHAAIEEHYTDEYFSLPELCQLLGMSRSQLFRKMKAVADIAPSDLIRSYRLNKAKSLLEQGDVTVAEVAYKVGFKDPSYFSKLFQEEFGVQPSAVIKL